MNKGNGRGARVPERLPLRVKVGLNPYANRLTCAHCRVAFERGGLWLRLEHRGRLVDMPLCEGCLGSGDLFETVATFTEDNPSFPMGLA